MKGGEWMWGVEKLTVSSTGTSFWTSGRNWTLHQHQLRGHMSHIKYLCCFLFLTFQGLLYLFFSWCTISSFLCLPDCPRILWIAHYLERLGSLTEPHGILFRRSFPDFLSHSADPVPEWQTEASVGSGSPVFSWFSQSLSWNWGQFRFFLAWAGNRAASSAVSAVPYHGPTADSVGGRSSF